MQSLPAAASRALYASLALMARRTVRCVPAGNLTASAPITFKCTCPIG